MGSVYPPFITLGYCPVFGGQHNLALEATHAFFDPAEAEMRGIRLELPE